MMLVTFFDGSTEIYDDEPFTSGGQGNLHMSRDQRSVIKLYHNDDRSKVDNLKQIIEKFNVTRSAPGDSSIRRPDPGLKDLFAWPNAIVDRPRLGVRMRNVNYELSHKPLSWWITGQRSFSRVPEEMKGNWLDRTRVASSMAYIAWKLHGSGLCHSDFSDNNFLVNVAKHKVVLIDLDALVIPEVLPPVMLGTGDYMAPEIVGDKLGSVRPTIGTDLHSLAVLIYQLLLNRHPLKGPRHHSDDAEQDDIMALGEKALYIEDPDDTSNRPQGDFWGAWLLGEEVEAMMRKTFTVGLRNPNSRPRATEWDQALLHMFDQIIPCANRNCSGKFFVLLKNRPSVCPWCQTPVTFPQIVPTFQFYDGGGQNGHFHQVKGRIVGWQGRTLHRWHTQTGFAERSAFTDDDRRALAEVSFSRNNDWLLANLGIADLRVADREGTRRISVGQAVPLRDGQRWLLGKGGAARLAVVNFQRLLAGGV